MALEDNQRKAAELMVRKAKLTLEQLAAAVGVCDRTISNWKNQPEFNALVAELREKLWREKAKKGSISDLDWTLRCLHNRHRRLEAIIRERGEAKEMQDAPGGKTGLLTVTYKTSQSVDHSGEKPIRVTELVPEYAVDVAMLAEMRAIEEAVATHLGRWKSRKVVEHEAGENLMRRLSAGWRRVEEDRRLREGVTIEAAAPERVETSE